jgi:hypothetical protein
MTAAIDHEKQLDDLVRHLAKLRLERERVDAMFLLALYEAESTHLALLKANGLESFERFLKSYKLCDAARYRSFVIGLEKIGREEAKKIGADATIEAASLTGPKVAPKYVEAIEAWREEHRGVAPTRETAAKILRQVDPREEEPQAVGKQRREDDLRIRCAELESENAKLRAALDKTQKERDEAVKRATALSKEITALKRKR